MDATRGKRLQSGLVRDLNPGPLAPEARIIPLDQRAIPRLRLEGANRHTMEPSSNSAMCLCVCRVETTLNAVSRKATDPLELGRSAKRTLGFSLPKPRIQTGAFRVFF
ncbi:hypothetical protein QQF64_003186 [Cirrhinus molitorella]|uniref:Uncharacterized protein n=1 Tax=Cirrhinus molitorella TaxID=172907 RepID=A0ABR3MJB0_9TELE